MTETNFKTLYKEQVVENAQLEQAVQYLQTALAGIIFACGDEVVPEEGVNDSHYFEMAVMQEDLEQTPIGRITIHPEQDVVSFRLEIQ